MTSIATPQLAPSASSTPGAPVQLQLSQALGQMIGQVLTGTVLALLNDTTLRLQTPAGLLDVTAQTPLPPGTPVAIAVQGSAQQPQIVITRVAESSPQPALPQPEVSGQSSSPAQIGTNASQTSSAAPSFTAPSFTGTASADSAAADTTALSGQASAPARTAPSITQAALSTAAAIVRDAVATQGGLATLYADLEAAVSSPAPSLPATVLDAARLLLAMRLNIAPGQTIAADDVETALMRAGLASAPPATAASAPAAAPADLGSALLTLRQALKTWFDQQSGNETTQTLPNPAAPQTAARPNAPAQPYRGLPSVPQAPALVPLPTTGSAREQAVHLLLQTDAEPKTASVLPNPAASQAPARANVPMPPYRGSPSVPQAPAPASLATNAPPREQAAHLLAQTDAAIARQTLLRIVSLPGDPTGNTQHRSDDNSTRMMFEIPLVTAQGTGVLPMAIERDGGKGDTPSRQTAWLANFSIDLPAIGPVHVRVALLGERAAVTLNAERAQSAELLAAGLPLLDAGLRSAQIEPGELRCLNGSAAENRGASSRQQAAAPGLFLDQAT